MNTKIILTLSAISLGLTGLLLSFLPAEIQEYSGLTPSNIPGFFIQLSGAVYFAFTMLNWMARRSVIGGIYNRPIAVANFTHYFIGAVASLKSAASGGDSTYILWAIAGFYAVFALLFAFMLMRHPGREKQ